MKYLMEAQKGSGGFGNAYRWSGSPLGKSNEYRGKFKKSEDTGLAEMEFQWNNDVWKASHRTSEDYLEWAKKNAKEKMWI